MTNTHKSNQEQANRYRNELKVWNVGIIILLVFVLIAVLHLALLVTSFEDQQIDSNDPLQNTVTVNVYSYRTEYIDNGQLVFTLYDADYYNYACAIYVVNSNGHTCVTEHDKQAYVADFLEDLDSYWQG